MHAVLMYSICGIRYMFEYKKPKDIFVQRKTMFFSEELHLFVTILQLMLFPKPDISAYWGISVV